MRTKWFWLFCLLVSSLWADVLAQAPTDKYWVFFRDKPGTAELRAQDFLTQRSLDRRARMGIPVVASDFPVGAAYVGGVAALGPRLLQRSKWLNAVAVEADAATAAEIAALPYVREVRAIPRVLRVMDAAPPAEARGGYSAGFNLAQTQMVGLDMLHKNGYNGHGVLIAMMDNGFRDADQNPLLSHLFETGRILATWDFVNNEADVYDQGDHGQWTLSILASWTEANDETAYWFAGSAHGATFILCHTENDASETSQEEYNWVAAMEYADSLGADLFSTSLGYAAMDSGGYTYDMMDGNTTIITVAADMAAAKGIVVVNSAGNQGAGKMLAPSDGDSVISVGAVNASKQIAGFSSLGPSYDGRIKPDISAMGEGTAFVRSNGLLSVGNGTSFSCPVSSGLTACLLQAAPGATNMEIYQALIQSADRYTEPDTVYGYGIPYGPAAYRILTGEALAGVPRMITLRLDSIEVYPNPAMDHFSVAVDNGVQPWEGTMELVDAAGRVVWSRAVAIHSFYNVLRFTRADHYAHLHSGLYRLLLRDPVGGIKHSAAIRILTER